MRHGETFGQAPALVQFNVDNVEAAYQAGNVIEAQHAFVGRDRYRRLETVEIRFAAALERLFQQLHVCRDQHRQQRFELVDGVTLVGVRRRSTPPGARLAPL